MYELVVTIAGCAAYIALAFWIDWVCRADSPEIPEGDGPFLEPDTVELPPPVVSAEISDYDA